LANRLTDISNWIMAGGKLIVHDRSAGNLNPSPLLVGTISIPLVRIPTNNVDVIPPGTTLVTAGPFGTINNTNLDGTGAAHGYADIRNLPTRSQPIISTGLGSTNVVAFSYPLGLGFVYYSSTPIDFHLGGATTIATNLTQIYMPNVLLYTHSLRFRPAVGYYMDQSFANAAAEVPIQMAGYEPVPIDDIASFDLNSIDILMLHETDNSDLSTDLIGRLPAIQSWVQAGGKLSFMTAAPAISPIRRRSWWVHRAQC
jgi:hypothetical protein